MDAKIFCYFLIAFDTSVVVLPSLKTLPTTFDDNARFNNVRLFPVIYSCCLLFGAMVTAWCAMCRDVRSISILTACPSSRTSLFSYLGSCTTLVRSRKRAAMWPFSTLTLQFLVVILSTLSVSKCLSPVTQISRFSYGQSSNYFRERSCFVLSLFLRRR